MTGEGGQQRETFARALERREQYEPARGPAVGWLLGIARTLIADATRRDAAGWRRPAVCGWAWKADQTAQSHRRRPEPVELDDEQLAAIALHSADDLQAALAATPDLQRDAVIRHIVLGHSYAVIAEDLATSEQVIRKRVSRGLANLRAQMEEDR